MIAGRLEKRVEVAYSGVDDSHGCGRGSGVAGNLRADKGMVIVGIGHAADHQATATDRVAVARSPALFWTMAWIWKVPDEFPAENEITPVPWPEVMAPVLVPGVAIHWYVIPSWTGTLALIQSSAG